MSIRLHQKVELIRERNTSNSRFVVSATGRGHYFGELYRRSDMCAYKLVDFENKQYPIMENYDQFLSIRYGENYMQLPPEDKRERHAFIEIDLHNGINGTR